MLNALLITRNASLGSLEADFGCCAIVRDIILTLQVLVSP